MKDIDNIFMETAPTPKPLFTPLPPEIYTNENKANVTDQKIHMIKIDPYNTSLRGIENHINKILVKCQNYEQVVIFIQCFIKRKTKGKQLITEMSQINNLEVGSLSSGIIEKN